MPARPGSASTTPWGPARWAPTTRMSSTPACGYVACVDCAWWTPRYSRPCHPATPPRRRWRWPGAPRTSSAPRPDPHPTAPHEGRSRRLLARRGLGGRSFGYRGPDSPHEPLIRRASLGPLSRRPPQWRTVSRRQVSESRAGVELTTRQRHCYTRSAGCDRQRRRLRPVRRLTFGPFVAVEPDLDRPRAVSADLDERPFRNRCPRGRSRRP